MWVIEYGADYADDYEMRFRPEDWDGAMASLSEALADHVDRRLIDQEEFEQAMEWITGVVIEDAYVRIPATFGGLSMAITLTD